MAQQDDYYYEIQLSNKQLVFYFLAGATGLILSFLAGVMVGRGVDSGSTHDAVAAAKPVQEERVVAEESPKPSPPAAEELTYAQRLDGDKNDDTLEKPGAKTPPKAVDKPSPKPSAEKSADKATDKTPERPKAADKDPEKPAAKTTPAPRATPSAKPTASPRPATAAAKPAAGTFTIQVGAFKDKETADSVVGRLKKKGFAAFVVPPDGDGLFNVRVGSYPARTDAERIQAKLRDEEKFKPFIVKN